MKANCTSRKDHRREGNCKALDGSKIASEVLRFCFIALQHVKEQRVGLKLKHTRFHAYTISKFISYKIYKNILTLILSSTNLSLYYILNLCLKIFLIKIKSLQNSLCISVFDLSRSTGYIPPVDRSSGRVHVSVCTSVGRPVGYRQSTEVFSLLSGSDQSTGGLPAFDRQFNLQLFGRPAGYRQSTGYFSKSQSGAVDCTSRPIVHNGRIFELSVDRASRPICPLNCERADF